MTTKTTTKTKTTKPDTASETPLEYELRMDGAVLDLRIRDMEMKIAFAESLVTTLTGIREDMIDTRNQLSQYARVGSVRDSWMLPSPLPRDET